MISPIYDNRYHRHTNLVLFEPFLEKLLPPLLENRPCKLQRFEMVEFTLLKQDAKILENGGKSTRRSGGRFESLDDLVGSQNTLNAQSSTIQSIRCSSTHSGRVGSNLGSLTILTRSEQLLILFDVEVISAR